MHTTSSARSAVARTIPTGPSDCRTGGRKRSSKFNRQTFSIAVVRSAPANRNCLDTAESDKRASDRRDVMRGIPSLGAGAIYPVAESNFVVEPLQIPAWYWRAYGLDVGRIGPGCPQLRDRRHIRTVLPPRRMSRTWSKMTPNCLLLYQLEHSQEEQGRKRAPQAAVGARRD